MRSTRWRPPSAEPHLMLTLERLEEVTERPAAAHRSLGDPAPAARRSPSSSGGFSNPAEKRPVHHRRRRHPQAAGDRSRHPDRGHVHARPGAPVDLTRRPGDRCAHRTSHVDLAEHLSRDPEADPRQSHRRSSSATPVAPPNAWLPSSTSSYDRAGCTRESSIRSPGRSSTNSCVRTTGRSRANSAW
jgi:hypothetical protein